MGGLGVPLGAIGGVFAMDCQFVGISGSSVAVVLIFVFWRVRGEDLFLK